MGILLRQNKLLNALSGDDDAGVATNSHHQDHSSKLDMQYGSRNCMGTIPCTLENRSTAGCNKFSSPRPFFQTGYAIAVLWFSKLYGYNPMHLRKPQCSWLQQILITEIILPNWIQRVIIVLWFLKVYGHNPMHLRKPQYTAEFSSQQAL